MKRNPHIHELNNSEKFLLIKI